MTPLIEQRTDHDCGFVCLAMLLGVSPEEIERVAGHDGDALIPGHEIAFGMSDVEMVRIIFDVTGRHPIILHTRECITQWMSPGEVHCDSAPLRRMWTSDEVKQLLTRRRLRAVINTKSLNISNGGHTIFWDGTWVLDPSRKRRYVDLDEVVIDSVVFLESPGDG